MTQSNPNHSDGDKVIMTMAEFLKEAKPSTIFEGVAKEIEREESNPKANGGIVMPWENPFVSRDSTPEIMGKERLTQRETSTKESEVMPVPDSNTPMTRPESTAASRGDTQPEQGQLEKLADGVSIAWRPFIDVEYHEGLRHDILTALIQATSEMQREVERGKCSLEAMTAMRDGARAALEVSSSDRELQLDHQLTAANETITGLRAEIAKANSAIKL